MISPVVERTSAGELSVTFGINCWVLVEDESGRAVQRQVRKQRELSGLLRELGLPEEEAASAARAIWRARSADAAFEAPDPDEGPRSVKGWHLVALTAAIIAVAVYWVWDVSRQDEPDDDGAPVTWRAPGVTEL